jgi:hypothetical protein
MKIGQPGDRLSLARVFAAMVGGALLLGAVSYLFDLAIGPAIGMTGWWTVFAHGGLILGAMLQAVREFATPQPAERRAVAAELRAREAARPSADEEAARSGD